jgi:hypothetical protein
MKIEKRIQKDLDIMEEVLEEVKTLELSDEEIAVVERTKNYRDDSKYYLEKKDYDTSFGCIAYAHGLIDALRLIYKLI